MRTYFGYLILFSAALLFSGCAERYYGRGGYYRDYGYTHHDGYNRRHDEGRYDFRGDRDDRR